MSKYDYTGKDIFVGLDVHKKTYAVAVALDGGVVKRDTLTACPETLLNYLRKFFSGATIHSAYEAGFSGFGLHRFLVENDIDNIVVHAASIEVSSRDRVKTDKRDATKIAIQLGAGRLRCVHIPSPEREDNRELTRLRDKLVKERTHTANGIKAKAYYYGLIPPGQDKIVSDKWLRWLMDNCPLAPNAKYYLETLVEEWYRYTVKIKEIGEFLQAQAKEDSDIDKIYGSAPGVGPIASRVLANELGDMSQFDSERSLFCYTGLTPSEHSSGEHRRQGHISRQGKSQLRKILNQAAWVAIRQDSDLFEIFYRISKKAGAKRAITGIARRLVGRIRSCLRGECEYRPYSKLIKKEKVA